MKTSQYVPRRGDIVFLDFQPQRGHEQAGRRPAIVLSPVEYNRAVGLMVVCPITNQKKGYAWEVDIHENPFVTGTILADQVKSMDWKQRRAEFLCSIDQGLLEEVVEKTTALISPEED